MSGITGCFSLVLFGRRSGTRRRLARRLLRRARPSAPDPTAPETRSTPGRPADPPPPESGRFIDVMAASDVAQGQVVEVMFEGAPVAIANVDGRYHALAGRCPHAGGPLGEGTVSGHVLTCPNHGWTFDLRDGRCLIDPTITVAILGVRVEGDRVALRSAQTG